MPLIEAACMERNLLTHSTKPAWFIYASSMPVATD